MATTGNRDWAFTEAKRRARAMEDAYSIYQHCRNVDDYIVRTAAAAPPDPANWDRVATFQPHGPKSFRGES